MKRTDIFYRIRSAIHAKNPDGTRKYKYILLTGSSRSSKTTSAIQNFYSEAWNNHHKRYSVWRETKKNCKDTVGKDMEGIFPTMPYYSPGTVTFHKTESVYSFPSGSNIEVCGTDDAERVHGYNGHGVWLNEPYQISRETFDQLDMRTEDFVIIDMNPKQDHWSDDLQKDPRCKVIHSTFKDNPYCPPEQKRKILGYQPVSMCEAVELKILSEDQSRTYNCTDNESNLSEGQIKELIRCQENERLGTANKFNWIVYGLGKKAERPNRIFKWNSIPDHEYDKLDAKKYYAVDWGVVDPWAILEGKYYDGALYLKELNYKSENEWMNELSVSDIEALRQDEGLVKWLFNKLGIDRKSDIICDTNRPMKISALWEHGYDYATSAPKPPGSIIDGIGILEKLKVYFTESSLNLSREQESYSRKVDRYGVVLEEPEDVDNHLMDGARYLALWLQLNNIIKML